MKGEVVSPEIVPRRKKQPPDKTARRDEKHLRKGRGQQDAEDGGDHRHGGALLIRCQPRGHAPECLGDNRDCRDHDTVQPSGAQNVQSAHEERERHKGDGGRKSEPGPGHDGSPGSRARETDGHVHLAARGPRKHLAEGDQIGESFLTQPGAPYDIRIAEVAEMRDGSAKRGKPETKRDREHFEDRADTRPWGNHSLAVRHVSFLRGRP